MATGVSEKLYNTFLDVDEFITKEELGKRYKWLSNIHHTYYRNVANIWGLLKPEIWARYKEMGQYDLREQKLLRETRRELKRQWLEYIRERIIEKSQIITLDER